MVRMRIHKQKTQEYMVVSSDGSRGCRGRAPPSLGQNFFVFMQFWGKIGQIVCWRPPLGLALPPVWEILDPPLVSIFGIVFLTRIPIPSWQLSSAFIMVTINYHDNTKIQQSIMKFLSK